MAHESNPWRYREPEPCRLRFPLPQGEGKGEGEGNEDFRSPRMCGCVSLTPALSRWERESRSASYGGPRSVVAHESNPWRYREPEPCRLRFPLPQGEGEAFGASLGGPRSVVALECRGRDEAGPSRGPYLRDAT